MDGFDTQKGVILLAATNRPELLNPALRRPGRCDRQGAIDRPDLKGRAKILRVHTRQVTLAPEVELEQIATRPRGPRACRRGGRGCQATDDTLI